MAELRRVARMDVPRAVRIRRGWWKIRLRHLSFRSRVYGIPVYAETDDSFQALYFAKVYRALELIERFDSRRLSRIRRDLRRVVVTEHDGPHYDEILGMCVLSWHGIHRQSAEQVALTIVHEATHGRISRAGIPYQKELRARIEAACVAQEVAFARRLPHGQVLAADAQWKLQTPWWTPEQLVERNLTRISREGAPDWMLRLLRRVARYRLVKSRPDA